jgi:dTDP-4-dehydrorhamnose reductase
MISGSRGIVTRLAGRQEIDIASEISVKNFLDEVKPWAIINAAGFTRINEAEKSAYTCFRENTTGPVILSEACRSKGIRFVTFSTDQVFSGEKKKPYTETDNTNPLNLYGLSKRVAEEKVMKINNDALIIRSSLFFNPWNKNDLLTSVLNAGMSTRKQFYLASDIIMSPAFIPDIVNNVLDLLIDGESGIWHLSSQDEVSYYEFARIALDIAGFEPDIITSIPYSRLKLSAARPSYSVLKSSCGITLPSLYDSLNSYINIYNESIQNIENKEITYQPSL